jgi:hypothetical protein
MKTSSKTDEGVLNSTARFFIPIPILIFFIFPLYFLLPGNVTSSSADEYFPSDFLREFTETVDLRDVAAQDKAVVVLSGTVQMTSTVFQTARRYKYSFYKKGKCWIIDTRFDSAHELTKERRFIGVNIESDTNHPFERHISFGDGESIVHVSYPNSEYSYKLEFKELLTRFQNYVDFNLNPVSIRHIYFDDERKKCHIRKFEKLKDLSRRFVKGVLQMLDQASQYAEPFALIPTVVVIEEPGPDNKLLQTLNHNPNQIILSIMKRGMDADEYDQVIQNDKALESSKWTHIQGFTGLILSSLLEIIQEDSEFSTEIHFKKFSFRHIDLDNCHYRLLQTYELIQNNKILQNQFLWLWQLVVSEDHMMNLLPEYRYSDTCYLLRMSNPDPVKCQLGIEFNGQRITLREFGK